MILILTCFLLIIIPMQTNGKKASSNSTIVMDIDSGKVLYEKNATEKKLIASTTKILTAIVVLENANIEKKVKVGEEVLKMYGTSIYLEVGEQIKIKDLLYGLLLRSGNDAAEVLAIAVSGSEEKFVKLMNKKAQKIGMKNSAFSNPHGLDEETQNYSTAYDMALLSKYAYQNKLYREITSTKKYEVSTGKKTYLWYNRNKLLNNYSKCTGGKNGYTPSAGKTLVTTASNGNLNLTVVTLNDGNEYSTHESLYEEIFNKYKNYVILDNKSFKIDKEYFEHPVYLKESFMYPLQKSEINKIKTLISINNKKSKDNSVGKITIYLDKKEIGKVKIYEKKIKKKDSILQRFKKLIA